MSRLSLSILLISAVVVDAQEISSSAAETSKAAKTAAQVVIVAPDATVERPEKSPIAAPLAHVYHVGRRKDEWLWVPKIGGWIHQDHVLPNQDGAQFFTERLAAQLSAAHFVERATYWSSNNKLNRAHADFDAASKIDPGSVVALNGMGGTLMALGRFDEAIAVLTQAIEIDDSFVKAYVNRGNSWHAKGDLEKALDDFQSALSLQPDVSLSHHSLGRCYVSMGNSEQAMECFREAIRLDPQCAAAFENRAYLWQSLGEYQKALEDFRQSTQCDPYSAVGYSSAAWLWAKCPDAELRDSRRALAVARKACSLSPDNWYCLSALAASLGECGDFDAAVKAQLRSIAVMPTRAPQEVVDRQRSRLAAYLKSRTSLTPIETAAVDATLRPRSVPFLQ